MGQWPSRRNQVTIPDFSGADIDLIEQPLALRYEERVETHFADSELKLDADSQILTSCPTIFWQARGCNFVVLRTAPDRFRCEFSTIQANSLGLDTPSTLTSRRVLGPFYRCSLTHEREHQGVRSETTGEDL